MKHHIIYVPGLGDQRSYGQNIAIHLWRIFGFTPHYVPLGWRKKDGLAKKLDKLNMKINELSKKGDLVSLVGASAGASAVINAAVANKSVLGVVYICGKINSIDNVHPVTYKRNPDFKESLATLQKSLEKINKNNTLSMRSSRDVVVPAADTKINGVKEKVVPAWGHASGIFMSIVIGAPSISKFLRGLE